MLEEITLAAVCCCWFALSVNNMGNAYGWEVNEEVLRLMERKIVGIYLPIYLSRS